MALKHLIRTKTQRNGCLTWRLQTSSGEVIESFEVFCDQIAGLSERTRKRYAEAVSRFIDYLFEVGIFTPPGVTARRINEAIEAYPLLLRDGSEGLIKRIEIRGSQNVDSWLVDVARGLNWERLRPASFSNTLAPVNQFLALSETIARQELERAKIAGLPAERTHSLINSIEGYTTLSAREVARMRQNSMFGSVAKFSPKGIRKPRRLALPNEKLQDDLRRFDFPLTHLQSVISAAKNWRDRAFWLLLAASGIRSSEAKNILLSDIDFDQQLVFVIDPNNRRCLLPEILKDELRFKGRAMAATYLFPPLRQQFFHALQMYLEHEYVPIFQPGQSQFLFQYVEPNRRGQPLVKCSDAALNKPFKAAVKKANVPLPCEGGSWTLHSLRHLYGVYMLNDYPLDPEKGRFGLELTDVQILMGHENINSTKKYARSKVDRLMKRLQQSDEEILGIDKKELSLIPLNIFSTND